MILGRHINEWVPEAKASVRYAPGGSLLILSTAVDREMCAEWRQRVPKGEMVGRLYEQFQGVDKVDERVGDLCRAFAPVQDLLSAVIVPGNEMMQEDTPKHPGGPAPIQRFTDYTCQAADRLHARGFPKVLGGNFSTTKPTEQAWRIFRTALDHLDGVVFHEYNRSIIDRGGFLHYQTLPGLTKDVYIGEFGIDDDHGGGWTKQMRADIYAGLLLYGLTRYRTDPRVKMAAIFQGGALDKAWQSFGIAGVRVIDDLFNKLAQEADPVAQTEEQQYPTEFAAWVAAGGIRNNFHAHLIAIGALTPTADDLKSLGGQALASAQQVKNALEAYPFP